MPGKPLLDEQGRRKRDATTGKLAYACVIDFATREAKERFQREATAAVRNLIGQGACQ
jgi:hypothetical protein